MLRCVGGRWRINLLQSSGCSVLILIFPLEFNRPAAWELIFCRSFCCFFYLILTRQSCAGAFQSLAVASTSVLFTLFLQLPGWFVAVFLWGLFLPLTWMSQQREWTLIFAGSDAHIAVSQEDFSGGESMPGLGAASLGCDGSWASPAAAHWGTPTVPNLGFPLLSSSFAACRRIGPFPASPCPGNVGAAEHWRAQNWDVWFSHHICFWGLSCSRVKFSWNKNSQVQETPRLRDFGAGSGRFGPSHCQATALILQQLPWVDLHLPFKMHHLVVVSGFKGAICTALVLCMAWWGRDCTEI